MNSGESAIVPFGKYKGQPVEVMLADPGYKDWILSQPWFRERFGNLYQVVINYSGEPQDTPEHNQMQASFLDDVRAWRLACILWPKRKWDAVRVSPENRAAIARFEPKLEFEKASIQGRKFEADGWDVAYGFQGASLYLSIESAPECICICQHSDCRMDSKCKGGAEYCRHEHHVSGRVSGRTGYGYFCHCDKNCPYSDTATGAWLERANSDGIEYSSILRGRVLIECKPDLGDDYPAVLRQVLRYPFDYEDQRVVIARRHRFQEVTWDQVTEIFAASGIWLLNEQVLRPVESVG